jgi:hypothetical protein
MSMKYLLACCCLKLLVAEERERERERLVRKNPGELWKGESVVVYKLFSLLYVSQFEW